MNTVLKICRIPIFSAVAVVLVAAGYFDAEAEPLQGCMVCCRCDAPVIVFDLAGEILAMARPVNRFVGRNT